MVLKSLRGVRVCTWAASLKRLVRPQVARCAAVLSSNVICILLLQGWQLPNGFSSVRNIYTNLHTKIFLLKVGTVEFDYRGTDTFTTFDKYYFALKRLKTREFCKNTNVFGFKNGRKCFDAQNLPDVTVSKALTGQIFPLR